MKAFVFDFDGTMIDTEAVWFDETQKYLQVNYGLDLPMDVYEQVVGSTDEPLLLYMAEQTNGKFDAAAFQKYIDVQVHNGRDKLEMRPGFMRLFNYAKDNGYKIGLATSSARAWVDPILEKFGILEDFETIQTADDVEVIKPDPALYRQAVEALGVKPEEAVAVEDSRNGSLSAVGAGLHVIVVKNEVTKGIVFPEGTSVYDSFEDVDLDAFLAGK
ncbi:putative phosphoglucomutase [Listeria weihenstephanensis FSL R9-0317]|uniref:Haloacid dehalogenase n=1 Tax=Listeria weihenstephanensis TaxID=1006155 RepID=A0A1S7FWV6_9LIST|nr:HAD family hydrolase [Listeria weihenstephanensis]AQY51918.1 haloacid dehalogenase [Listeria weihenstephanensis]EUJ40693.1 putative phosphoglucomutase [Listeria weihenstephanensis FSL R9-0317]